jgi:hypothetical protein
MQTLLQRKTEIENEIKSLQPPLWYSQVKRKDELIKELKGIRLQEVILNAKKIKAVHNRA